jgi:MFS family permease
MHRLLHIDLTNPTERNSWYLVLEIFWATFLGAAASFNAAFAIRLGATDTQVGLLTSLPALLAVLVLIPAGRFLNTRKNHKAWLLGSLALYRSGFLVVAIIPWLKFAGINQGALLVFWLVFLSMPVHFFNVGFYPMLTEVIPPSQRVNVFTARNVIYNAALSVCVYFYGQWLNRIEFPINYQLMYVVSYFVALLSLYYLVKIQIPEKSVHIHVQERKQSLAASFRAIRKDLAEYPDYRRIVSNTLLHSIGLWMASPLYMLYYVRDLQADDAWIGLLGAVSSLATIGGFLIWRNQMQRLGELRILKFTIVLGGLYPLLVGLTHSLTPILIWVAINGLVAGGISLSHLNTLLRVTPEKDRPGYTAFYMTVMNIGAVISPMIGVALSELFGFPIILSLCGLLSIIGSFSFWVWPIKSEPDYAN